MPIFYDEQKKIFHLTDGETFSYILAVEEEKPSGVTTLLQTYWGAALGDADLSYLADSWMDLASFDATMQYAPFAYPARGRGDFRPVALEAIGGDGMNCAVLQYQGHAILPGKPRLAGLPAVYTESDSEADTLSIRMQDPLTKLTVTLRYTVMNQLHALTQSVLLENQGAGSVTLRNPASACVHLRGGYDMVHLHGSWGKERYVERVPDMHGVREISSCRGASGHQHNPFLALAAHDTTEQTGDCYGMALVYSGSFQMKVDQNAFGGTRFVGGVNACQWLLHPGEMFQTPEMLLVYSENGLNGMSRIFHKLIRSRICRGYWRDRERPVLVNNWEGTYFDFTTDKLLGIARQGAFIGAELFVLDDGWFGKRNSDNCSLGDWVVNEEKLPGGLSHLAREINALGLKFGLWFEPEMISPDSDLYRAHPDWCLHVPGRDRSTRRHQLILDMTRTDVQDYIIRTVSAVLESAPIEYVKWDMNRNFAEVGSACLPAEQQGEVHHRYMLGLYRVLETITARFPHVLFESCSGGGGRFDAGMLYYMPQTWTSDDSDAVERLMIQYGTSLPYPTSAMGAHVSAVPNHQVGRVTTLKMRGDVAMSGNFGYELDLTKLSDAELSEMKEQVAFVKQIRHLTQQGNFTRLQSPFEGDYAAWQFADDERNELLVCIFRRFGRVCPEINYVRVMDVDEKAWYVADDGKEYHGSVLRHVGIRPVFTGYQGQRPGDAASMVLHLTRKK